MESHNDETTRLVAEDEHPPGLTTGQAVRLYVSHAFSTWNARGYEFAAILFTAAAYPDTLVAAALRMIIIYLAMILFSSSIGGWVQNGADRLRTLLTTIVVNRTSVILGSFFWLLILSQEDLAKKETAFVLPKNDIVKHVLFAVTVAFGIIERLSASGNLISMERDWVVTVAAPPGQPYDLAHLNAVMRRIDLVCKLLSPILISVVISATGSVRIGVLYSALTSLVSIPIETISARGVWNNNPRLRSSVPKSTPAPAQAQAQAQAQAASCTGRIRQFFKGFEMYFSTSVWVPSVALCLLHFNMMTWSATFITYLINIGYSLTVITVARAVGSIFEISSTVATPRGIEHMGKACRRQRRTLAGEEEDELAVGLMEEARERQRQQQQHTTSSQTMVGLQRFGLWGVSWQVLNSAPVVVALWAISASREKQETTSPGSPSAPDWRRSLVLFSFLSFSRFGVWVFDLTTQQLTQVLVPEHQRSQFAGVETSIINIFEILGAAAAISFPRTDQFKWLSLASFVAVTISWALYAGWVKKERGHLLHWERLGLWNQKSRR